MILLLPYVLAGERETVKSGKYKPGGTFTVDDLRVQVADLNNQNAVTLIIDEERVKITEGDCTNIQGYEFCLTAVSQSDEMHPRFDVYLYEYVIDVFLDIARVSITQTPEKTELGVNEKTDVTVVFENHGAATAQQVSWEQTSEGLIATDSKDGCYFHDDKVGWSGTIFSERTHECTYVLQAKTPGKYDLKGTLQWFDGKEHKSIDTKLAMEVGQFVIVIEPSLEKDTVQVGEKTDLTLKYRNTLEKESIDNIVTFIPLQKGLTLFQKTDRFEWDDFLRLLETKEVKLRIIADAEGTYTIPVIVKFNWNQQDQEIKKEVTLRVEKPTLTVSITPSEVESQSEVNFKLVISNPLPQKVKKVAGTISSQLLQDPLPIAAEEIDSKKSVIVEKTIVTPYIDGETTYPLRLQASFILEDGATHHVDQMIAIKVKPKPDVIIGPIPDVVENLTENLTENKTEVKTVEQVIEKEESSKLTNIIIGVVLILLLGAGFGALTWWRKYQSREKPGRKNIGDHSGLSERMPPGGRPDRCRGLPK